METAATLEANATNEDTKDLSESGIKAAIVSLLADVLGIQEKEIETAKEFDYYGLDSSAAIGMTDALAEWLAHELEPELLFDHPTIDKLALYLFKEVLQNN